MRVYHVEKRVPRTGLEPARLAAHAPETCASTNSATWAFNIRSITEISLFCSKCGAENGTRTRDPNLGKVVLYQLSYFRIFYENFTLLSASLSIAGAKVQHFFEPPKLLLHFFLKKCKRRANPFYLYSPRSQIDAVFRVFRHNAACRWQGAKCR